MNRKLNSKTNNSRKGRAKKSIKRLPNLPFPLLATPSLGHTFQFTASSAAAAVPITRADLLNLMQVASSATALSSVIGAICIRKIRAWSPIISAFTPQVIQIEWNGGLYAPSAIHSATSEGLFPAKLGTAPPPMSSPSLWSLTGASNTAEVLFTVTCPANTVIQLTAAVRLMDDEGAPTTVVAVGATLGKFYYGALDGLPSTAVLPASGGVAVAP